MQVCPNLLNQQETKAGSCLGSIITTRAIATMSPSQNSSPRSDDVNSPSKEKFKTQSLVDKVYALSFGLGKG